MTKEELAILIDTGREIEFVFEKKRYSITYANDGRDKFISVCEFYKEPVDASNVDELWSAMINGKSIKEMFISISDDEIWIF